MTDQPQSPREDLRLAEQSARAVLSRAIELEAREATELSVRELREIAVESGISSSAFDAALNEFVLSHHGIAPAGMSGQTWLGRLRAHAGRVVRWIGGLSRDSRPWFWTPFARNALAFGACSLFISLASRVEPALGLTWGWGQLAELLGFVIGTGLAFRLRAYVTATLVGAAGMASFTMMAMQVAFGSDAVQGGPARLAVVTATLIAIVFGRIASRDDGATPSSTPEEDSVSSAPTARPNGGADSVLRRLVASWPMSGVSSRATIRRPALRAPAT